MRRDGPRRRTGFTISPGDVGNHLELTRRVLKPGGVYLIRTPHAYTGPHDISMYFSEAWNERGIG